MGEGLTDMSIVSLYIVIPYLLVLFLLSMFFSVTVILLHCGSFCHENKFLVCVNIPVNKADSDVIGESLSA